MRDEKEEFSSTVCLCRLQHFGHSTRRAQGNFGTLDTRQREQTRLDADFLRVESKLAASNSSCSAKFGQNISVLLPSGNVVLPTLNNFLNTRRQFVARSQSAALERSPLCSLRQIRPLTFSSYTICLTLPNFIAKFVRIMLLPFAILF